MDGAIHRAAGRDLVHECGLLDGRKIGEANLTNGYRWLAKWRGWRGVKAIVAKRRVDPTQSQESCAAPTAVAAGK